MSGCGQSDAVLVLLEDELDPAERVAAEAHLAGCALCREALAGYRQTAAALHGLEPERPSDSARARAYSAVLEAMAAAPTEAATPAAVAQRQPAGRVVRLWPQAVAAAACLLLTVAILRPPGPEPAAGVADRSFEATAPSPTPTPPTAEAIRAPEPALPGGALQAPPPPAQPEAGLLALARTKQEQEEAAELDRARLRLEPDNDKLDAAATRGLAAGEDVAPRDAAPKRAAAAAPSAEGEARLHVAGAMPGTPPQPGWIAAWTVGDSLYALDATGTLSRGSLAEPEDAELADGVAARRDAKGGASGVLRRAVRREQVRGDAGRGRAARGPAAEADGKDKEAKAVEEDGALAAPPAERLGQAELAGLAAEPAARAALTPVDAGHDAEAAADVDRILVLELATTPRDQAWASRAAFLLRAYGEKAEAGEGEQALVQRLRRRAEVSLERLKAASPARALDLESASEGASGR